MCLFCMKNIFAIFIIPIFWNILDGMVFASESANDLKDLKTSYKSANNLNYNDQLVKENSDIKNFAEGGLITSNSSTPTIRNTSFNIEKNVTPKISIKSYQNKSNSTFILKDLKNKTENGDNNSNTNLLLNRKLTNFTKLIDGGVNLLLGAPEVIHINGSSSIKPRKGVYFNKIVPRKGVDPEYEFNHTNLYKCLLLRENECYISNLNFQNAEIFCCNKTYANDDIRQKMPSINCSICSLTNILYKTCQHVCFKNVTDKKIQETQNDLKNPENIFENKDSSKLTTYKKIVMFNTFLEDSSASPNKKLSNSFKKLKSKPKITKVPDDIEFVDNLFSRSKRDVLMPILVSIFLLPLIGMVIFFIWKRTKEYWNKRYYKRMDFLIDGMYNDQYS